MEFMVIVLPLTDSSVRAFRRMPWRTCRAGPGDPELLESCWPSLISSGFWLYSLFLKISFSQDPRSKGLSLLPQSREELWWFWHGSCFHPSVNLSVWGWIPDSHAWVHSPEPSPLLETWEGDQDSSTTTKVTTRPTRDYPSLAVVCGCFGQHESAWSWKPCSCVNPRKFLTNLCVLI